MRKTHTFLNAAYYRVGQRKSYDLLTRCHLNFIDILVYAHYGFQGEMLCLSLLDFLL